MDITQYLTITNRTVSSTKNNKYIVIHYTANNGDTAINNAKYFYSENRGASAHYFVDENEIVQVVEDKNIAWHCGTTGTYYHECRNSTSLGIEMCSRKYDDGIYYIKDEVVDKTIELTQYLMELHGIPAENVIMHYDVTHKSCPAPFVINTNLWTDFKNKLTQVEEIDNGKDYEMTQEIFNSFMDGYLADKMDNDASEWSKEARDWSVDKGIVQGTANEEFNGQWENFVTREQMVTILQRYDNLKKGE